MGHLFLRSRTVNEFNEFLASFRVYTQLKTFAYEGVDVETQTEEEISYDPLFETPWLVYNSYSMFASTQ